jgi:hypothetical protein
MTRKKRAPRPLSAPATASPITSAQSRSSPDTTPGATSNSTAWLVAGVAAVVVYSWVAAGFRPFTTPEEVMVAIPIVLVAAAAVRRPSPSATAEFAPHVRRRGAGVWVALVAAITLWELIALFSSPREDHPTLSSVADRIMSVHVGRAFMFALWLVAGVAIARRRSSGRRRR